MERLIDDLTRLHTDLERGSDGGTFDIAGLAKEAVEAIEKLLKDIDIKLKALVKAEEELATYRQKQANGLLVELSEFPQDMNDLLEPLKIQSALNSEMMKLNYRRERKAKDISILDYTIIAALVKVLREAEKALEREDE